MEESKNIALGNWIDFNAFELDVEEPPFILKPDEIMTIKKSFDIYDFQQVGSIEVNKMRLAMLRLGIEPDTDEIRNLMKVFDKNNSGRITFNTFLLHICGKMAEENLGYDFVGGLFDLCSGKISLYNCDHAVKEMFLTISDEELHEILQMANLD
ncbi:uncharacterized protein Dwil_GK17324 [Drosophila willistoni]|uniref:EF-hand domain-containing protein n=1 Tax=Drosophila willistoni TaxID=7260 RepID=B4MM19_DROWI|nr:caltractin [Drosophila willistoni]EDW73028.1 uncharacterized protein Dwil_GK17324 [Drosophila willistoni]